jgi:23S rRNA (adenine2503-C2)-methyltransferase
MPLNKKYPITEIVKASKYYNERTREQITYEYVLLKGLNDSSRDAQELIKFLDGIDYKINLIPYNDAGTFYETVQAKKMEKPDKERVFAFQKVLTTAGIKAFIRKERGADILAACGQLAGRKNM